MTQSNHNGNFHGQKSNLDQLGPKGIQAQGASSEGNSTLLDAWLEKNDDMDKTGDIMVAEEQGSL